MRNLEKFQQCTQKCQNWDFSRILLSKVENIWGIMCHDNEEWYKTWRETDWYFENWHRNLINFYPSTQRSKKICFNGLLVAKVYNARPKKVQRSYLSWRWRVMQNLKKNSLVVWKMTWEIWQIFTRVLESVKIGTLMGSFCPKTKMYELKIYGGVMCHGNEE